MHVTTGVSSLDKARASTPPTDRVRPSLANSLTNCMRQSMLMLHSHPHIAIHTPTKADQQCIAQEGFLFAEAFCISCTVVGTGVRTRGCVCGLRLNCHRVAALLLSMSGTSIHEVNRTWMVKTIPTKAAVSRATDKVLGPTSLSCSSVFLLWTLPAYSKNSGFSCVSTQGSLT